jgi:single-stranded-DNA-specific exonuclease
VRERARAFFAAVRRDARLVVYAHFDADGLAAGALFGRALPRLGFTDVEVVPSGRAESAFSDSARARLRALAPEALVVTDLGVRAEGVLDDVPTLYVDHHRPEGIPPAPATVVTGYAWTRSPARRGSPGSCSLRSPRRRGAGRRPALDRRRSAR